MYKSQYINNSDADPCQQTFCCRFTVCVRYGFCLPQRYRWIDYRYKSKFKMSLLSNKIQNTGHNTMCMITYRWLDYNCVGDTTVHHQASDMYLITTCKTRSYYCLGHTWDHSEHDRHFISFGKENGIVNTLISFEILRASPEISQLIVDTIRTINRCPSQQAMNRSTQWNQQHAFGGQMGLDAPVELMGPTSVSQNINILQNIRCKKYRC